MTLDSRIYKIKYLFSSMETLLQKIWNRGVQNGSTKPAEETGKTVESVQSDSAVKVRPPVADLHKLKM